MWVKLDDSFFDHPKIASLSDSAFRSLVWSLCYCSKYHTDGLISSAIANSRVSDSDRVQLTTCQPGFDSPLWETVDGGYMIHDFLKYNPSRKDIMQVRESRSAAGRRGAEKTNDRQTVGKHTGKRSAKDTAKVRPDPLPLPHSDPNSDPTEPTSQSPAVADDDTTGSDSKKLLDHHVANYKKRAGCNYPVSGQKDMAICKRMVKTYGLPLACSLSDQMFKSVDDFIRGSGYTFGALAGCASKLAIEYRRDNPVRVVPKPLPPLPSVEELRRRDEERDRLEEEKRRVREKA